MFWGRFEGEQPFSSKAYIRVLRQITIMEDIKWISTSR